jgi:hypothetical protein
MGVGLIHHIANGRDNGVIVVRWGGAPIAPNNRAIGIENNRLDFRAAKI